MGAAKYFGVIDARKPPPPDSPEGIRRKEYNERREVLKDNFASAGMERGEAIRRMFSSMLLTKVGDQRKDIKEAIETKESVGHVTYSTTKEE